MVSKKMIPRGIRNCNPLNIRIGNTWLGERNDPDDTQFEQFVSMTYGLRAAFVILRRYIRRYKLCTVRLIVSRWAPANENDTAAYIQHVASECDLNPDTPIAYEDETTMCKLVAAMAKHECGQPIKFDDIIKAYRLT